MPDPIPATATGVVLPVVVPSPNCPSLLLPQQSTAPVDFTAQMCPRPPVMPATPDDIPDTAIAVILGVCVVPSPT
jgi:hypothetical protein